MFHYYISKRYKKKILYNQPHTNDKVVPTTLNEDAPFIKTRTGCCRDIPA